MSSSHQQRTLQWHCTEYGLLTANMSPRRVRSDVLSDVNWASEPIRKLSRVSIPNPGHASLRRYEGPALLKVRLAHALKVLILILPHLHCPFAPSCPSREANSTRSAPPRPTIWPNFDASLSPVKPAGASHHTRLRLVDSHPSPEVQAQQRRRRNLTF